ncbi:hypothetical protein GORHZ_213_01050 [Gordonia rhizosphera NBRC 16068]|uniref:Uncharacterized protein n=1 Tax=Gordonia rhizosphera NBRC 16068 TaxID=1108045 RepID=K6X3I1_9ACTN|nr:hypothetical protein GORHZ_213_01050 [Gordonia rhizosphera NBRC 16068]
MRALREVSRHPETGARHATRAGAVIPVSNQQPPVVLLKVLVDKESRVPVGSSATPTPTVSAVRLRR